MMMTDQDVLRVAREIAAHALCGPEKWKPGVKAGMYEDIMRGAADTEALVQGPIIAIERATADERKRCVNFLRTQAVPVMFHGRDAFASGNSRAFEASLFTVSTLILCADIIERNDH